MTKRNFCGYVLPSCCLTAGTRVAETRSVCTGPVRLSLFSPSSCGQHVIRPRSLHHCLPVSPRSCAASRTFLWMDRICGSKPMSSKRSASSSTRQRMLRTFLTTELRNRQIRGQGQRPENSLKLSNMDWPILRIVLGKTFRLQGTPVCPTAALVHPKTVRPYKPETQTSSPTAGVWDSLTRATSTFRKLIM